MSVGAYVLTSVTHDPHAAARNGCHCNFQFSDGSVRALQQSAPVALAVLTRGWRRGSAPARVVASHTGMAALQSLLAGLRRHGASVGAMTVRPAQDPLPVLMVIADQRDFMDDPISALLFLVADQGTSPAFLLPAVQSLREGARRIVRHGDFGLVLVQRPPGPGPRLAVEEWSFSYKKI